MSPSFSRAVYFVMPYLILLKSVVGHLNDIRLTSAWGTGSLEIPSSTTFKSNFNQSQ